MSFLISFIATFSFYSTGAVNPCLFDPNAYGCQSVDHPNKPVNWKIVRSFPVDTHPESALVTDHGVYVTTMGKETGPVKNGDGDLVRYDVFGNKDQTFQSEGALHSPMGMAVIGEKICLTDIDHVICFDTSNGQRVVEMSLESEGVDFLNDIVALNSKKAVVSATNKKAIFIIDFDTETYLKRPIELGPPNGLSYDPIKQTLYLVGNSEHNLGPYGNGFVMALRTGESLFSEIVFSDRFGRFVDGVEVRGNTLLVSDWKDFERGSSLLTYSLHHQIVLREQDLFITGGADFSLGTKKRRMAMPNLLGNRVFLFVAEAL